MLETDPSAANGLETLLEAAELRMYADLYAALPDSVGRECGVSWDRHGASLRLSCRSADHTFFNRVMGVRDPGPERGAWLREQSEHYREAGVRRWMLQIAPGVWTRQLEAAMRAAELVPLRGWAKHAAAPRRVPPSDSARSTDLRVVAIGPRRAADWAAIVAPAFAFPAGSELWLAATVGRASWRHYLAYDGDLPVASAALHVAGGIGTLTFAATRETHRRRGAQSALIAARLRAARELDLDWIVTETDEELPDKPNPSYHNVVRLGLPVRYVRANWGPPPPRR